MITEAGRPEDQLTASGFLTDIKGRIPAGAYLVYCFRMPDYIRCDPEGKPLDGSNRAGVLFESLEPAMAFAKYQSNRSYHVGFGVYDSAWRIQGTYISDAYLQERAKAESPSRLFLWAAALILSGGVFVWFDAHSGWTAIFGVLIGSRLLFGGFMKLATGLYRIQWTQRKI